MEQCADPSPASAESVAPSELAAILTAAQQRALEQRLAVEELLAEARSLEERLATETLQARIAVERNTAREHAAEAVASAQFEHEAILRVEACASRVAELADRQAVLENAAGAARAARDTAAAAVAECERRLDEARSQLTSAVRAHEEADAGCSETTAARAAADAEAAAAAAELAEHRATRQRAEAASAEAEERARALGAGDDVVSSPSLEAVEELRLFETRVALRAEAAKRAAERRASDLARSHVIN